MDRSKGPSITDIPREHVVSVLSNFSDFLSDPGILVALVSLADEDLLELLSDKKEDALYDQFLEEIDRWRKEDEADGST